VLEGITDSPAVEDGLLLIVVGTSTELENDTARLEEEPSGNSKDVFVSELIPNSAIIDVPAD
jgi:hypothetical protein